MTGTPQRGGESLDYLVMIGEHKSFSRAPLEVLQHSLEFGNTDLVSYGLG
jgi:hypothetical protein